MKLVENGILKETTNAERNRVFSYKEYLNIMRKDALIISSRIIYAQLFLKLVVHVLTAFIGRFVKNGVLSSQGLPDVPPCSTSNHIVIEMYVQGIDPRMIFKILLLGKGFQHI